MGLRKPKNGGGDIPTMTNPAQAENILNGFEACNPNGELIIGTHDCEEGLDTSDATAIAGEILSGKTAYVNGQKVTGSMINNGAKTATLNAGNSYTIPAGYHDGTGKVTANSLASQTDGNATAGDILSGQTAYVDGAKVTGSMTNNGAVSKSINAGGSYTIPAGYHNGSGKVTGNSLSSQTSATATAANIESGKTAWVNGVKVTGTGNFIKLTPVSKAITGSSTVRLYNFTVSTATGATLTSLDYATNAVAGKKYVFYYNGVFAGYGVCFENNKMKVYAVGDAEGRSIDVDDLTFYELP